MADVTVDVASSYGYQLLLLPPVPRLVNFRLPDRRGRANDIPGRVQSRSGLLDARAEPD